MPRITAPARLSSRTPGGSRLRIGSIIRSRPREPPGVQDSLGTTESDLDPSWRPWSRQGGRRQLASPQLAPQAPVTERGSRHGHGPAGGSLPLPPAVVGGATAGSPTSAGPSARGPWSPAGLPHLERPRCSQVAPRPGRSPAIQEAVRMDVEQPRRPRGAGRSPRTGDRHPPGRLELERCGRRRSRARGRGPSPTTSAASRGIRGPSLHPIRRHGQAAPATSKRCRT